MTSRYWRGPVSDHFDGTRFHGPGPRAPDKTLADLRRWRRTQAPARWPRRVAIVRDVPPPRVEGDAIRVSLIGHATVLLQTAGLNILFDPVFSDRASPVAFAGPRRVTEPGVALADLPPLDAICVSHNHYDHMDVASLARLARTRPCPLFTTLGNIAPLPRAVRAATREMDWGESAALAPGVTLRCQGAYHWSSRGWFDRRRALWGSFVVTTPTRKIWFAADTAFEDGALFDDLRARHGGFDLALIPIGAYAPRWFMKDQHVDPFEAVRIFQMVGARQAVAIHWGVFQLTDEPRDEPPRLLAQALAEAGVAAERFPAPEPGTALVY
jgi:L-ascorbate metabolism protein UlaG (beta-lactamase superfamily)